MALSDTELRQSAGEPVDGIAELAIGDAAAIGEAAAAQDPRARVREPGQRFADQARFPDPRSADDGEQMRPPILRDAREGIQEQPQLAVAADKRSGLAIADKRIVLDALAHLHLHDIHDKGSA